MIKRDPRDILTPGQIDELWSNGYTIAPVRQHVDPWFIPPDKIPPGRQYQWVSQKYDVEHYTGLGWQQVPAERHPGLFAPWGYSGPATVGDLILIEKPKQEVEAAHAANRAKATKAVDDWKAQAAADGLFGHLTTITTDGRRTEVNVGEEKIEAAFAQTQFPSDLFAHYPAVMRERDRLLADFHWHDLAAGVDVNMLELKDRAMRKAIENIRATLPETPTQAKPREAREAQKQEPIS